MVLKSITSLFVVCLALALTIPVFAQQSEEAKETPAQEKAEKAMSGGSAWVKSVQEALKAKGNDPGPIDGHMGPKTKAAIKAFQEANSLKGTGKIDKDTADKLGVEMPKMSMHHHPSKTEKNESTQTKP